MSTNPSIKEAKRIAKAHGKAVCVIFTFGDLDEDGGPQTFHYASYGLTKDLCSRARAWADEVFDKVVKKGVRRLC